MIKNSFDIFKKFYKENKDLLNGYYLNTIFIFTFATILTMILNKYYNYDKVILSYVNMSFTMGFLIGFILFTVKIETKINYFKYLYYSLYATGFFVLLNLLNIQIQNEYNKYIFLVIKSLEGVSTGIVANIFSFLIKNIYIKYRQDGTINGYMQTIYFFMKGFIPIVASYLLIIEVFPLNPMLVAGIGFLFLGLYFQIKEKFLFYKYYKYIRKRNKIYEVKNYFLSIYKIIEKLFKKKENRIEKIYYIETILLTVLTRPFFELYIPLLLMNKYNYTITQVSFIAFSLMFGQSKQFISGYISDKVKNMDIYRILTIATISIPMMVFIFFIDKIANNFILTLILFYIIGTARGFEASYDYKLNIHLVKEGVRIAHINLLQTMSVQTFLYLTYLLYGILLHYTNIEIKEFLNIFYFIILMYLIIWLVHGKKVHEKMNLIG